VTAPSFPDFSAAVSALLEPHHADVAKELGVVAAWDMRDHDAARAVERLRENNLFSLVVPARHGGRGFATAPLERIDLRALCLAREALGWSHPMADSILAVQGLFAHPLIQSGDAVHAELLAQVAKGDRVGGFALTEPEAGSDVGSMKTTARREGAEWVLDGTKVFISNVGIADHFVVFARVQGAPKPISAFLVGREAPGLVAARIPMSLDHPLGRLEMHGCRVPANALVGDVGQGMRLALGTLDVLRTSVGAAACGMARRALDEARRRVRERVQFGKPLADFQLTQAAVAEMATELDAARLLVYRAARLKDAGERASVEVAMAKMFATEAAQRIIDRAVQLFGGLGVALGSVVEQLYREIRPLRIYEGTTEIQKLIIGGALLG